MRQFTLLIVVVIALLVAAIFAAVGPAEQAQPSAMKATPRLVLAFYYPWYGRPDGAGGNGKWIHWDGVDETHQRIATSTHYPSSGPYDSQDPATLRAHMKLAKEAGLDGLIVSWWGAGTYEDRAMPLILDAAKVQGLKACIYYEKLPDTKTVQAVSDDIRVVVKRLAGHDAWLKVNGRPVIFVYGRTLQDFGMDNWKAVVRSLDVDEGEPPFLIADQSSGEAAAVFDGIHVYNPAADIRRDVPSKFKDISAWAESACRFWVATARDKGKLATATIIPGYDDTKIRKPGLIVPRDDGALYTTLWEKAIAAKPDWVLICSFNEWHEGSEIEPSIEEGRTYIDLTRKFADRFRGGR